jgi:hypothetical protein
MLVLPREQGIAASAAPTMHHQPASLFSAAAGFHIAAGRLTT